MDVYLPIAEVSLDIFVLLGLGAAVGFLSGVFGVGGGFLLTPLLILIGVPPPVAVASSANQLVGASLSGVAPVRWLELIVSGTYWWLPVVWLARRGLHAAEEECCDARVLAVVPDARHDYAEALVQAITDQIMARNSIS